MKNIVIAPMGDNMDALFVGIKEFQTEKVILITPKRYEEAADKIVKDLNKFKIPSHIIPVKGETEVEIWESVFMAISEIRNNETDRDILINVATGDRTTRCAATSAGFVNGLKSFATDKDKALMLPVMKFDYYKMISDKKMELLKLIHDNNCCSSLEELSRRSKMSLPLISYHINGNLKSEGLKEMGLVETKEEKNRVSVELTSLGRMIVRGYIKPVEQR